MDRHRWINIEEDGVYCRFCRHNVARGISRGGRATFLTGLYTGTRPYHLSRHEDSSEHMASAEAYSEMVLRTQTNQRVEDTIHARGLLTVDGDAFCDALRCLYWFCKQEIPHTTNFASLRSLCILLGNSTLSRLKESKNMTYESE